jgi:predicted RNase H-like nuclease (RuvC/YqgF family)
MSNTPGVISHSERKAAKKKQVENEIVAMRGQKKRKKTYEELKTRVKCLESRVNILESRVNKLEDVVIFLEERCEDFKRW